MSTPNRRSRATVEEIEGSRLVLPPDPESVADGCTAFRAFLLQLGLSAAAIDPWELACSEALTNAIRHGIPAGIALGRPADGIELVYRRRGSRVECEVADPGPGPSPLRMASPVMPEDPLAEGGRGLALIRASVDGWAVVTSESGTALRLWKDHPELAETPGPRAELDLALDELSRAHEGLAAFNRLGALLVSAERSAAFVREAGESLRALLEADLMVVRPAPGIDEAIRRDLAPFEPPCPSAALDACLAEDRELRWHKASPGSDDPLVGLHGSGFVAPVRMGGELLGAIALARSRPGRFTAGEADIVRTYARLLGIVLSNERRLAALRRDERSRAELVFAAEIQGRLRPPRPERDPRWELSLFQESARVLGGDYAEAHVAQDGSIYLVVGDAMGKGVPAALVGVVIRTALRFLYDSLPSPETIAASLDRFLREELPGNATFATLCVVRIDPGLRRARVANAGHCPLLHEHEDGRIETHAATAPPLGVGLGLVAEGVDLDLAPGDALVLLTDGLYEGDDPGDDWERLVRRVGASTPTSGSALWMDLAMTGADGHPPDDQTLVHWRLLP